MRIVTEHVYPPIPIRQFDWSATTDNYEPGYPLEHGRTEKEAVENLLDGHCKQRGAGVLDNGDCALCFAAHGESCRLPPREAKP